MQVIAGKDKGKVGEISQVRPQLELCIELLSRFCGLCVACTSSYVAEQPNFIAQTEQCACARRCCQSMDRLWSRVSTSRRAWPALAPSSHALV